MGDTQTSAGETARVIRPDFSPLSLPEDSPLRRLPRAPNRKRPATFTARFEDRIIFYDCFWHDGGEQVLLVGPPPFNLAPHQDSATYTALPSGRPLTAVRHTSRSTQLTVLSQVPRDTSEIAVNFAGDPYTLRVQPNHAADLAGSNLLFTMSKDNPLAWIACWARWHVAAHGVDTIIFIDNGSTSPALVEIERQLSSITGLKNLVLIDWPHRYGATDKAVIMHRFWAQFLQVSAMNMVLRRFGATARGLLNCDIDELVVPQNVPTLFEALDASENGLVHLSGTWVESTSGDPALAADRTHFAYQHVSRTLLRHLSPAKWLVDPKRDWVRDFDTFPYMHDVKHPPENSSSANGRFWHFKGINSNWKSKRQTGRRANVILHTKPDDLLAARRYYDAIISKDLK